MVLPAAIPHPSLLRPSLMTKLNRKETNLAPVISERPHRHPHHVAVTRARSSDPLDELEREDFFRLKKIQGYKKREIERQMAAAKLFAEEQLAEDLALKRGISVGVAANLLGAGG